MIESIQYEIDLILWLINDLDIHLLSIEIELPNGRMILIK